MVWEHPPTIRTRFPVQLRVHCVSKLVPFALGAGASAQSAKSQKTNFFITDPIILRMRYVVAHMHGTLSSEFGQLDDPPWWVLVIGQVHVR